MRRFTLGEEGNKLIGEDGQTMRCPFQGGGNSCDALWCVMFEIDMKEKCFTNTKPYEPAHPTADCNLIRTGTLCEIILPEEQEGT